MRRYVTRYLAELRALSDKLVFVSTAPLSEEEVERRQLHADEVVLKDNVSLDFGMWKHVIDRHELSEYDELVLTNSSMIGLLRPLQPIFSRMASRTCDFWGMTENFDGEWHFQSYFLVLKKKVMRSVRLNLYFKWLQRPLTGFIEWLFARGARPTTDSRTPRF